MVVAVDGMFIANRCISDPALQEPIRDPARFPCHEVRKVQHYWLEVDAMTKPMALREDRTNHEVSE